MQLVVVSAVAAAVMAATITFNSTSQKLFLFIRYSFLFFLNTNLTNFTNISTTDFTDFSDFWLRTAIAFNRFLRITQISAALSNQ